MSTWFNSTPESEAMLAEERLILAATELVYEAMDKRGVSKKELADRLQVRPTEVSSRLRGTRNLTLRTFAAMLHALDARVELALRPKEAPVRETVIRQHLHLRAKAGAAYQNRPPLRVVSVAA